MEEIEVFDKLSAIASPQFAMTFGDDSEQAIRIAEHKSWLSSIRHERPATNTPFKVGVYIRYFNQTKYENYLSYHKKQFADTIALCPKWTLVDFYIDEGASAPNMETAPEWSRLLMDASFPRIFSPVPPITKKTSKTCFSFRPPIGKCCRKKLKQEER